MNIPASATDNLYKYMTVLGTFLTCVSVYAFSQVVESHDIRVREVAASFSDGDKQLQEFWTPYLNQQKANVDFELGFLTWVTSGGIVFTLFGAVLWFAKLQRKEDLKHWIEFKKLQHEKKAFVDTDSIADSAD